MKKIIILALCAASFAVAARKECVSFADTAGEGCWIYNRYSNGNPASIYEVKGERARTVCGNLVGETSCDKVLRR